MKITVKYNKTKIIVDDKSTDAVIKFDNYNKQLQCTIKIICDEVIKLNT